MKHYLSLAKLAVITAVTFGVCGCAGLKPTIKAISPEDTPRHSYDLGSKALEKGDSAEALRNFQRSIGLDPKYQFGYIGLALAYSAGGDYKNSETNIKKAIRLGDDTPACYVAYGRIYLAQGEYGKATDKFHIALEKNDKYAEAYYWKGRTWELKKDVKSAAKMYRKALEADRQFLPAEEAWQKLQDAERERTGLPKEYLAIAASAAITRGETAALLEEELGFDRYLEYQQPAKIQASTEPFPAPYDPAQVLDMAGSWASKHIEKTLRYGVMEAYPDQKFQPEKVISRGEFALVVQNILIKAKKGDVSPTMFLDSVSPFSDVPNTNFAFNSAMLAVSRGFLQGRADGTFGAAGPVAGAEAIAALKKVRGIIETR